MRDTLQKLTTSSSPTADSLHFYQTPKNSEHAEVNFFLFPLTYDQVFLQMRACVTYKYIGLIFALKPTHPRYPEFSLLLFFLADCNEADITK